jgi:hypothetical protein
VGSPLAYIDYLRGVSGGFEVRRGETLTCPPRPHRERAPDGTLREVGYGHDHPDGYKRLHHAALFVLTRWTNLYYPGDVFGGPLCGLLGSGIDDRCLMPGVGEGRAGWSRRVGSHVRYWGTGRRAPLDAARRSLEEIIFPGTRIRNDISQNIEQRSHESISSSI